MKKENFILGLVAIAASSYIIYKLANKGYPVSIRAAFMGVKIN